MISAIGDPTPQGSILIDRMIFKMLSCTLYEKATLQGQTNGGSPHIYLAWANSLRLDLQAMGMDRKTKQVVDQAHMDFTLAGSIVHKKTGSMKLAQSLLGHSRMDTTADICVYVDEKAAEKAAEAVAEAIIPSCSVIAHSRSSGSDQVQ